MGYPVFAAENIYNGRQFPSHTVSANEEATGHEAILVGRGRRGPTNYWTTTTANQQATLVCDQGAAKPVGIAIIDRGHNLGGVAGLKLQGSVDAGFTSPVDLVTVTIPTVLVEGAPLNGPNGALMEDGAWAIRFATQTFRYIRWLIPALGAGTRPVIVGTHVGPDYRPGVYLDLPYGEGDREIMGVQEQATSGWAGTNRVSSRKSLDFTLKLASPGDYTSARRYFEEGFLRGFPMWCFWDEDVAERSWVAKAQVGTRGGFRQRRGWHPRQITLQVIEHEHLTA